MNRYELALIAGIATAFVGFFVFTEYLLGAEPPEGFRMQPVPIYCGPAAKLRDQLLLSKSRPVFTGSAFNGAFMIFQPPPPSKSFMATFWRDGSGSLGCIFPNNPPKAPPIPAERVMSISAIWISYSSWYAPFFIA